MKENIGKVKKIDKKVKAKLNKHFRNCDVFKI